MDIRTWKTIAEEWHRLYYAWTRMLLAGKSSTADRQIAQRQARIARRRLKAAGIADTHAPPSDWPATFGRREPVKKVKPYRGMARDLAALQRFLQVFDHPERFPALAAEIAKRLPDATGEQTYQLHLLQQLLAEVNEKFSRWEEEWRAENATKAGLLPAGLADPGTEDTRCSVLTAPRRRPFLQL